MSKWSKKRLKALEKKLDGITDEEILQGILRKQAQHDQVIHHGSPVPAVVLEVMEECAENKPPQNSQH